jgi:hypothetical protein
MESKDASSLYAEMKRLQTKLEFLDITETYVKDEMVSSFRRTRGPRACTAPAARAPGL